MPQEMPRRNPDSIPESDQIKPESAESKPKSSRKTMTGLFSPARANPISNDDDDSRSTMESYERTIPPTAEKEPETTGADASPGSGDTQIGLGPEDRPSTEITPEEIIELAAATSQKILERRKLYEEESRAETQESLINDRPKSPWEGPPSSSDIAAAEKAAVRGLSNKTRVALAVTLGAALGATGTGIYRSLTSKDSTDSTVYQSVPAAQNPESSK